MERINKSEFNRTSAERYRRNIMMTHEVRQYIVQHFHRGGTLEEFQNDNDIGSNPGYVGQHQSVHIVRLPIPATQDGLFVIKNLGVGLGSEYPRDARDLYAEACAMILVGRLTQIPVPWVYFCCRPDETDPQRSFIAMEYIEGEIYGGTLKLTRRQKNSIIRQMAIIRIEMIKVISGSIGSVGLPTERSEADKLNPEPLNPAREMCGLEVWAEGRKGVRNANSYDLGPYPTIRAYVLAFLEKEIAFHNLSSQEGSWQEYAGALRKKLEAREYAKDTVFHLSHGDLAEGNNVVLNGSRIVAIIDWEAAGYLPFSEAIADLLPDIENELQGDDRPTYKKWLERMNEKYGRIGYIQGGLALSAGIEPLGNDYDLCDEFDIDLEYRDDEDAENVGGDWWRDEALPQTWRLVELWMLKNGYDQEVWRDPIVFSICREGISIPEMRLFVE